MSNPFRYGTDQLTVEKTIAIASGKLKAVLSEEAINKIKASQQYVQQIVAENKTVYGINTGFGILANTPISKEDTATLQYKILQSHSVGVGDPIPVEVAKIMLITKVHALAQGFSGVQFSTLERITWHIENDVIPVVPEKGSIKRKRASTCSIRAQRRIGTHQRYPIHFILCRESGTTNA